MDANDLARWTRFAAKGGIGRCTALQDCVAHGLEDLMFLKDDEIVVLLQLPQDDQYLGYCEGVVGRFHSSAVRFHGKLKKPVFAKRQSAGGSASSHSPSRPISHSSYSPTTHSPAVPSVSGSSSHSSPASRVPSVSPTPNCETKPTHVPTSSVSAARRHGSSHSRTASPTSSSSHYSTHPPAAARRSSVHVHTTGIASAMRESESAQHLSASKSTPRLTGDSSFPPTPVPAPPTFEIVTSSQGHVQAESENFYPQQGLREMKQPNGGENSTMDPRETHPHPRVEQEDMPSEESFMDSSLYSSEISVLQEEDSEVDIAGGRAASVSGRSDISDGAFGIGMTLLRDDEDDEEDESEEEGSGEIGGGESTARLQTSDGMAVQNENPQLQQKIPHRRTMRVMNPSFDTETESETLPEDDAVKQPVPSTATTLPSSTPSASTILQSSSAERVAPSESTPSQPRVASSALASDEDWDSDGDIYDDYRYSRASSSHSPLHSRASKSSGGTRMPPLPDGRESVSRSSTSTAISRKSVPRMVTPPPPPPLETTVEVAKPAMGTLSPLTGAFRQSNGSSMNSRQSESNGSSMHSRQSEYGEGDDTFVAKSPQNGAGVKDVTTFASSLREQMQKETRAREGSDVRASDPTDNILSKNPAKDTSLAKDVNPDRPPAQQPPPLTILTSRPADETTVIVLNESPTSIAPSLSPLRSRSPSPNSSHLRVNSPVQFGSTPPSPLNPGYPPSPSSIASTPPLTINKNPSPPVVRRPPAAPPAIPIGSVLSPGQPPSHPNTYEHHQQHPAVPPAESLHSALRLAGQHRARTIHGHVQTDLLAANGPVPISFLLPGSTPARRAMTTPVPPPSPDAFHTKQDVPQPPPSPLPRANFFPKVSQPRPRSRSFSGFRSDITEKVSQSLGRRSQEEDAASTPRPSSTSSQLAPSPAMGALRGKAARPSPGPSPLSLPPTTNSRPASSARPLDTPVQDRLRQAPSHSSLRQTAPVPPRHIAIPHIDGPLRPPSPLRSPSARYSQESDHPRSDLSTPPPLNGSPSSLSQNGSLRSRVSMPVMRGRPTLRVGAPETPSSVNGPVTPTDEDTIQVRDLEFELVRPVLRGSADLHRGEETIVDFKERPKMSNVDRRQDSPSSRSEAPSLGAAPRSTGDGRHATARSSPDAASPARKTKTAESVQAHRERELKWMTTINSSDAAQARKSKKIKKLIIEGVPSSVRYLVWAHLSNSGSKKIPNVYAQLSKRRPAFAREIERDVEQSFPDHPHLRDPNGPLVSVLCAFIAMVPDLRYHRGLAIIAGNLLLQSPEEDGFWTFLAMMDSHLRPYFMPTSPQMAVDASMFAKAVENAEPQLAKRLFTEYGVRPLDLCGTWFSAVFAGTLPLSHLHRVWDLFFYEGVPLLFRVGLTILFLSQRYLLESPRKSPSSYTNYLLHPPPDVLPADPDQFISQALSVKLKDDEIRKMRLKLSESASKQQRAAPRMSIARPRASMQAERLRSQ